MQALDWFRPPRQPLVVFLAVALVSATALGWLGWLLLDQDTDLEVQRRQERIELAADRAAATMQRSLADLQSHMGPQPGQAGPLPLGVLAITLEPAGSVVSPAGSLLYVPVRRASAEAPPRTFAEGERFEFASTDPASAALAYAGLSRAGDAAIRAGALARLARVRRKQRDPDGALRTYDELARIDRAHVDGLPATLVARVGRASVFSETGRSAELRQEANALQADLQSARWLLVKPEYEFYSARAGEWLKATPSRDPDALTRAEAVGWLWENRGLAGRPARRLIPLASGPAFVAWSGSPERLDAVVAGPTYLAALCSTAIGGDLRLSLSDQDGHLILGDAPPTRQVAVRAAAAEALPWTLHVFAGPDTTGVPPSARRQLLILVFAVVALVLLAGWYFILRAMSRESRVSRLQSDFVAAVSHEFRSPLTSMSHIAEMLAGDRFPSDDLRRKSYDVLVRDTDRLRRLVESLLDFGRFEAGAATLRIEPVDIADLVRAIVADFRDEVAPDGYSIEFATDAATDAAIAPTAESGRHTGMLVHADREALSRALWNLLDNAVKYSPHCRTVWVALDRQPDRVSIVVRDQGLGIPVREQREIFDRFVRGADPKALRIKGTGIGLAMVRQIVQAHGGEIRLTSEPGRGSMFTVVLPCPSL